MIFRSLRAHLVCAHNNYDLLQDINGFATAVSLEQQLLFSTDLNSAAIDGLRYDVGGVNSSPDNCALSSASVEVSDVERVTDV